MQQLASENPANLVFARLVGRPKWPSWRWCIALAAAGYLAVMMGGLMLAVFELGLMFQTTVFRIPLSPSWLVEGAAWLYLAAIPPAAAAFCAALASRDGDTGALMMLRLTDLPPRAIYSGYVRVSLYRLRLLLVGMVAILPLLGWIFDLGWQILVAISTAGFAFAGAMLAIILVVRLGAQRRMAIIAAGSISLLHIPSLVFLAGFRGVTFNGGAPALISLLVTLGPFVVAYALPRLRIVAGG